MKARWTRMVVVVVVGAALFSSCCLDGGGGGFWIFSHAKMVAFLGIERSAVPKGHSPLMLGFITVLRV
jgi:hypothetical protein